MSGATAVFGAGAWGTTLALHLHGRGRRVRLWEYFPEYAEVLRRLRANPKFLPGVGLPAELPITSDPAEAAEGCDAWVMAVPAQRLRAVARTLARTVHKPPELVISAAKGIEQESLARMSEVLVQELRTHRVCALSGPSHAEEVSRGRPCSVVAAARDESLAREVQDLFMNESLRVYTSTDLTGVELGGAMKNIIAIAAGIVDGLGLGDNAKAALVTRGLAEMARLGSALAARGETFAGLSGLGDLVVTCMSHHSRNRRVGEELGRGRRLADILRNLEMVAEGVDTSRSVLQLAARHRVELPITEQVNRILFEDLDPREAVRTLMGRSPKAENRDG